MIPIGSVTYVVLVLAKKAFQDDCVSVFARSTYGDVLASSQNEGHFPTMHENEQVKTDLSTERPNWEFDDEFDGGEETCGRVIVNLFLYIRKQPPGYRILLISRDPGAPVEFPAWCRMTQNELTAMYHPHYLITLKPEKIRR